MSKRNYVTFNADSLGKTYRDQSRPTSSSASRGQRDYSEPAVHPLLNKPLDYAIKSRNGPDRLSPGIEQQASAAPRAKYCAPRAPRAPPLSTVPADDPLDAAGFIKQLIGKGSTSPFSKQPYSRAAVAPEPNEGPYRSERSFGCHLHGIYAYHTTSECNALRKLRDFYEQQLGVHRQYSNAGYPVRSVLPPEPAEVTIKPARRKPSSAPAETAASGYECSAH